MLRRLFIAIAAIMAITTASAQSTLSLEDAVKKASEELPIKSEDGSSINALSVNESNIVLDMSFPVPAEQFSMFEQSANMLRPTMLQGLLSDKEVRDVLSLASAQGKGFSIVIRCASDTSKTFSTDNSPKELSYAQK